MVKSNFHMHTNYCDGKSNAVEYVETAIRKGFSQIGFSSHTPISIENEWSMRISNLKNYLDEIDELKQKFKNKIEIYTGLEMDFLFTDEESIISKYEERLDYKIGSVHYLYDVNSKKYYSTDGYPEDLEITFAEVGKYDSEKFVKAYYDELIRIIKNEKFDVIGHMDIIKKRNQDNKYFDENSDWYKKIILNVVNEIKKSGKFVEINSGGISRGYIKEMYPSNWIIEILYENNIPIVISSDAHVHTDIDSHFDEMTAIARKIGYTSHKIYSNGKWVDEDF